MKRKKDAIVAMVIKLEMGKGKDKETGLNM